MPDSPPPKKKRKKPLNVNARLVKWLKAGGRFEVWSWTLRKIEGRMRWELRAKRR